MLNNNENEWNLNYKGLDDSLGCNMRGKKGHKRRNRLFFCFCL